MANINPRNADQKSYALLSQYYSDRQINVSVQGSDAYTNGKEIVVPEMGEGMTEYMIGYLAHENAHCKFTDFDVISKNCSDPIIKEFSNVFEDIRIEKKMCVGFPRVYTSLNETVKKIINNGGFSYQSNLPLPTLALAFALTSMRSNLCGNSELSKTAKKYESDLKKRFCLAYKGITTLISDYAPKMACTSDAVTIAQAIRKIIDVAEQKTKQEKNRSSKSCEKNRTNDQEVAEQMNDFFKKNDPFGDFNKKIIQHAPENKNKKQSKNGETLSTDKTDNNVIICNAKSNKNGSELVNRCGVYTRRLSELMRRLVECETTDMDKTRGLKGRLIGCKLSRTAVNDAKVFDRRHAVNSADTAIHLLCDISGSMRQKFSEQSKYTLADAAQIACYTFAGSLENVDGVSREVSYFHGCEHPIIEKVIKANDFVRKNSGKFLQEPLGETPTGEAVRFAAGALQKSGAQRKIIIIMTDGAPNDENALKQEIAAATGAGIEIIGIRIGNFYCYNDAVCKDWPAIEVVDMDSLQKELTKIVKALLKR